MSHTSTIRTDNPEEAIANALANREILSIIKDNQIIYTRKL